jgi:hypothetical protein
VTADLTRRNDKLEADEQRTSFAMVVLPGR